MKIENTEYPYICSFGAPLSGITDTENTQRCESCDDAYIMQEEGCV